MRDTRCDSASCRRAGQAQVLRAGERRRSINSPMVCIPARRDSAMSPMRLLRNRPRWPKARECVAACGFRPAWPGRSERSSSSARFRGWRCGWLRQLGNSRSALASTWQRRPALRQTPAARPCGGFRFQAGLHQSAQSPGRHAAHQQHHARSTTVAVHGKVGVDLGIAIGHGGGPGCLR